MPAPVSDCLRHVTADAPAILLSEPWLEKASDAWQGQQQGASTHAGCAPLAPLEGAIAERTNLTPAGARAEKAPPAWWAAAVTLGHLESKLFAA